MKKHLPQIDNFTRPKSLTAVAPQSAMARWNPAIHAANDSETVQINLYDMVGDYWGDGLTARVVASILRNADNRDISVNINSPGGDFFEGVAIYNLLREYKGHVMVRVVGVAASAASIIAMAGDTVKIAESGFLMIHDAWTVALGNKQDMREAADMLQKFDEAMAVLYAKRTGMDEEEIKELTRAETWLSGREAVESGFADDFLDSDKLEVEEEEEKTYNSNLKKIDAALRVLGTTRKERRAIIKDVTSKPGAATQDKTMPCAGDDETILNSILETLNQ